MVNVDLFILIITFIVGGYTGAMYPKPFFELAKILSGQKKEVKNADDTGKNGSNAENEKAQG